MPVDELVKVVFELEQDADGYPPDRWESLWAMPLQEDLYRIDNIAIFIKGISSEDVVSAKPQGDQLVFTALVNASGNSVFRISVVDANDALAARNAFRDLGCASEQSYVPTLFAVELPKDVAFDSVADLLVTGAESERWDYEEGVLRHPLPEN